MNIGSVLRNYSADSVQSANTVQSSNSSVPPPSAVSASGASQVQVSQPGQLMKQLSDLQQSDPAKFKDVVQQLSDSFSAAAKNATGEDATRLGQLADKFAQAAQSGDMSALQPQQRNDDAVSGSQGGHRNYARHSGGAGHHAPSQSMQDAFSSALSIVKSATSA